MPNVIVFQRLIDSSGNLYVTDFSSVSNKIQKFESNGTLITSRGTVGSHISTPGGIDVDSSDNIYVVDLDRPDTAVQVFTSHGTLIGGMGFKRFG